MPKNYVEGMVEELLPKMLKNIRNTCKCYDCTERIKRIALNSLTPVYCSDKQIGELFLLCNNLYSQYKTDITTELTKAIMVVSKDKRCN